MMMAIVCGLKTILLDEIVFCKYIYIYIYVLSYMYNNKHLNHMWPFTSNKNYLCLCLNIPVNNSQSLQRQLKNLLLDEKITSYISLQL